MINNYLILKYPWSFLGILIAFSYYSFSYGYNHTLNSGTLTNPSEAHIYLTTESDINPFFLVNDEDSIELRLTDSIDCVNNSYCVAIEIKAALDSFQIGTSSILMNYNTSVLAYNSYTSLRFNGSDLCIANTAPAWDEHVQDGSSVPGLFNVTLNLTSEKFSCPAIDSSEWISIGLVCFDILDITGNPQINFDVANTSFNRNSPNDGTGSIPILSLTGIDEVLVCPVPDPDPDPDTASVDGGRVSIEGGGTEASICVGDGLADDINFVNEGIDTTANYAYIITDDQNIILELPAGANADFEGAVGGICRVWGLSYTGNLTANVGDDAANVALSDGLYELSENFITINRTAVGGGTVSTDGGETEVSVTIGDGNADVINFASEGAEASASFTYVITDDQNNILDLPAGDNADFEGAEEGVCRVWGLSYTGSLTANIGDDAANVALSDSCYALSTNFITINRITEPVTPPNDSAVDEIEIRLLNDSTDCEAGSYCVSLQIKARSDSFQIGTSSILINYDTATLGYNAYTSLRFNGSDQCIANTASAWEDHVQDGTSIPGLFNLTLTLISGEFSCPAIDSSEWISIGQICFDIKDTTGNPLLNFDQANTNFNRNLPNDGSRAISVVSFTGISEAISCGEVIPPTCPPIGTPCDDGDILTRNDSIIAVGDTCLCLGEACPATGTACDDLDPLTENDVFNDSCQCIGTPIIPIDTTADNIALRMVDSLDCSTNSYCVSLQIKALGDTFLIGTSSMLISYNESLLAFREYASTNFNGSANCIADAASAWDEHVADGSSVPGLFNLTLSLTSEEFSCPAIGAAEWIEIGQLCFDLVDSTGNPNLAFDETNTNFNRNFPNDGTGAVPVAVFFGINDSIQCGDNPTICPPLGTVCDDGNLFTINDSINIVGDTCICVGEPCPAVGTSCDDGNPLTENDAYNDSCQCVGDPIIVSDDALQIRLIDSANCTLNTFCATVQIKAITDTFRIGTSSILIDYDPNVLAFSNYQSSNFDGSAMCLADVASAWDEHVFDGTSVPGLFNLTLSLSAEEFSCPNINSDDWTDIGIICFDLLDTLGNPNMNFDQANTNFNRNIPNDGTQAIPVIDFQGIDQAVNCLDCPPAGTTCDDGNQLTINDVIVVNGDSCACIGEPCPPAGTTCDDNNPDTFNDQYDDNCMCAGIPETTSNQDTLLLQFADSLDCDNGTFCATIQIRASSDSFRIGTSSILVEYNSASLLFDDYESISFDGSDLCIAESASAWEEHAFDGTSVDGLFNLTLALTGEEFSCPSISANEWIDIGKLCFVLLDGNQLPELTFNIQNTNFNRHLPNDGTGGIVKGTFAGFNDSLLCEGCPTINMPCDDGDSTTINDMFDANCNCVGEPCPPAGTTCDDGDPTTENDTYDENCNCIGIPCPEQGTICDDGDPNTIGDVYDANCNCIGVPENCAADGEILYERWEALPGSDLGLLTQDPDFPLFPDIKRIITTSFEGPVNDGNEFGAKLSAVVCAPVTGDYTFWISGDDQAELYLSPTEDPFDKQLLTTLTDPTGFRTWDSFAFQQTSPVSMIQGEKYYIEVIHKENNADDHISLGWQRPDSIIEQPISGIYFSIPEDIRQFEPLCDLVEYEQVTVKETNDGNVQVFWELRVPVAGEYIVEKSFENGEFIEVGRVIGGTDQTTFNYLDSTYMRDVNLYRVRKIISGIPSCASEVVSINFEEPIFVEVFPNPVSDELFIRIKSGFPADGVLDLVDATGRIISALDVELDEGSNLIRIPVRRLSPDIYFLRLESQDIIRYKLIIKI